MGRDETLQLRCHLSILSRSIHLFLKEMQHLQRWGGGGKSHLPLHKRLSIATEKRRHTHFCPTKDYSLCQDKTAITCSTRQACYLLSYLQMRSAVSASHRDPFLLKRPR